MPIRITDLAIRNAEPRLKKYTLAAGKGLTLLVMPDGAKYWRLRYRIGGKAKSIAVGKPYPETLLKAAEVETFRLRAMIDVGTDPANAKLQKRLAERTRQANTFGEAAEAWHVFRSKAWSVRTAEQAREYLDKDLLPPLQKRPLDEITPRELALLLRGIEDRGAFNIALKTRQWLKAIFSFARANGWTAADPARDLAAVAQPAPEVANYAHLALQELPEFLRAVESYQGSVMVKACAKLALWTANRPGITRTLRWDELDVAKGLWKIKKGREGMKRGYSHVTPLPTQARAMLNELRDISGQFEYVFIGRNDPRRPISDGAIAGMIKTLGYRSKQTMHGFRHLISTALNERGYPSDYIERQLAHGDPDKIRRTYNKANYVEQRAKMMQDWADYLDAARASGQSKSRSVEMSKDIFSASREGINNAR